MYFWCCSQWFTTGFKDTGVDLRHRGHFPPDFINWLWALLMRGKHRLGRKYQTERETVFVLNIWASSWSVNEHLCVTSCQKLGLRRAINARGPSSAFRSSLWNGNRKSREKFCCREWAVVVKWGWVGHPHAIIEWSHGSGVGSWQDESAL